MGHASARRRRDSSLCYSNETDGLDHGKTLRERFIEEVRDACHEACAFHALPQNGADMGARMDHAIMDAFGLGASSCVLIGSDLPYVTDVDMSEAADALTSCDVVLGPSDDGGYWLVGVEEPFSELFQDKSYGGSSVLAETISTCRQHGKSVSLLHEASDVDVPSDFLVLCERACQGDSRLGRRTASMALQAHLQFESERASA